MEKLISEGGVYLAAESTGNLKLINLRCFIGTFSCFSFDFWNVYILA